MLNTKLYETKIPHKILIMQIQKHKNDQNHMCTTICTNYFHLTGKYSWTPFYTKALLVIFRFTQLVKYTMFFLANLSLQGLTIHFHAVFY